VFCLFVLAHISTTAADDVVDGEDKELLDKLFTQQVDANNNLVMDYEMANQAQSLAQQYGCVENPTIASGSRQNKYVLDTYGNLRINVWAPIRDYHSNFDYNNPISGWKNQPSQWNNIVSSNRFGCSATVHYTLKGDKYCMLCYYATSNTQHNGRRCVEKHDGTKLIKYCACDSREGTC